MVYMIEIFGRNADLAANFIHHKGKVEVLKSDWSNDGYWKMRLTIDKSKAEVEDLLTDYCTGCTWIIK